MGDVVAVTVDWRGDVVAVAVVPIAVEVMGGVAVAVEVSGGVAVAVEVSGSVAVAVGDVTTSFSSGHV